MNPDVSVRPSATQLLQHPSLRTKRRMRCLRIGWSNARHSFTTCLVGLMLRLLQLILLFFLPIKTLARKWRKCDSTGKPSTPLGQQRPTANGEGCFANDFSFSDGIHFCLIFLKVINFVSFSFLFFLDEVNDLSSTVLSGHGHDSTLGLKKLNDSSPLRMENQTGK